MSIFQIASALIGGRKSPKAATSPLGASSGPVDGEPVRRAAVGRIVSLLGDLTRDESRALVDQVVCSFGRRVHHLPASEKHHHREPWGLLDHSIEVAEYAVRAALGANFMDSVAPHPEVQEFRVPRLRYAAFLFALFHDIGKILGVSVQSGRRVWNPFAEDLAQFVARPGGEVPSMIWRAGRGADAHQHHTAYLLGIFLPGPVAEYLTAPLLTELLERRTAGAVRVFDLVAKADQQSTKEDLDRREKAKEASEAEPLSYPELTVGYRELVAKAFSEGLREDLFTTNTLGGDLWVGREYVALRYPAAVGKLAQITRERLGAASQKARLLPSGDAGARELAHQLSELDLIFRDAQAGSWKVQMALTLEGNFQVTAAVLFKRSLLLPGTTPGGLELFPGAVVFTRPSDNSEMAIQGFRMLPKPQAPSPGAAPAASSPKAPEAARPPVPSPPPAVAVPPKDRPAPPAEPGAAHPALMASLRSNLLPGVLLEDIRRTILDGKIPVNQWNAQVYVLEDRTYFVTPNGFRRLIDQGLYSIDPSKGGTAYLDALAKLDCVFKFGSSGRVVAKIRLRENAKPCSVVVFQTRGLFKTDEEIARVGFWTETQIVEEGPPAAIAASVEEADDD